MEVGPSAFADVTTLADVLKAATQRTGFIVGSLGLQVPSLLSSAQEGDAIAFNAARFASLKAVIAIQGLLSGGKAFSTDIDVQTVQLIADLQRVKNLPISGQIDDDTLQEFVTRMIAAGQHNSALLLIAEGHSAIDTSGLLDFAADLSVPGDYELDAPGLAGPTSVRFGQETFKQDFAGMTHTVAHAATEAQLLQNGITSQEVRGFLGARTEILSIGMEEEGFGAGATGKALFGTGFIQDAEDALYNFKNMTVRERKRFFRSSKRSVTRSTCASSPRPRPTARRTPKSSTVQSRSETHLEVERVDARDVLAPAGGALVAGVEQDPVRTVRPRGVTGRAEKPEGLDVSWRVDHVRPSSGVNHCSTWLQVPIVRERYTKRGSSWSSVAPPEEKCSRPRPASTILRLIHSRPLWYA